MPLSQKGSKLDFRRFYILIFFILQQVGAEVSGLFTFQTVAHFFRLGGVGNHSDGIVVAYVLPEPVEQYHHLVLYAEDGAEMNHQPQYPGKEYIALIPDDGTDDVYIYGYKEVGEDEFELIDIEDDAEFEAVVAEFDSIMDEQ